MSDLISLTCPNCGGDLKITAGTTSYTCQHCGKQHIIKAEAGTLSIESYARCPKCGRNDAVKKVVSIVNSQTVKGDGGTQVSALAKRLDPLPQPRRGGVSGSCAEAVTGLLAAFSILGLFSILYELVTFESNNGYQRVVFGANYPEASVQILSILMGVLLILFLVFFLLYRNALQATKKKDKVFEQKYNADMESWKKSMQKWERLYYCQRDDCVFDMDENTAISPENLHTYLRQESGLAEDK